MKTKICALWRDAPWEGDRWPFFSPREFAERSEGWAHGLTPIGINEPFLDKLTMLRVSCGFPFFVTSAYRSPAYNVKVSRTGNTGPHTTGRAVDIGVTGAQALEIVSKAEKYGFTGVGVKQNGPHHKRFIHLDDLKNEETSGPRPWMWSY